MPRFDFRCTSCSKLFEATLPFGLKDMPSCPECQQSATVEKLLTPPLGIHFKGSGFYKTDDVKGLPKSDQKNEKTEAKNQEKPKKEGSANSEGSKSSQKL